MSLEDGGLIQPETIIGRKKYFRKKHAEFIATWYTDKNNVVHIPLGHGYEALIDAVDKELAAQFPWRLHKHSCGNKLYVEAYVFKELCNQYGRYTSLHRVVMNAPKNVQIDHKHGNGLDCRRAELRFATQSQNAANRKYINKTGYRGVIQQCNKFAAQIEVKGKNHYLGTCNTPIDAALLYNVAAQKEFGEFAILNDLSQQVEC
jgi:hypothetical protein